jgi:hypothetical protein
MQLTNNAVQKEGRDYGKFEEGNIISVDTLFAQISKMPQANGKLRKQLLDEFYNVATKAVADTMKSVKGKITLQKYTFELFGYDFIIDNDFNTVLIEVNTNPCIEESNKLLKTLIPRMLDDMFTIVMDPLFTPNEPRQKSKFPLPGNVFLPGTSPEDSHPGYKDNENLFKHICSLD